MILELAGLSASHAHHDLSRHDRLLESSPTIDQDIIAMFNKRFNKDYPHVSKPIVCNGLREVRVYKEPSHADDTPVDDAQNEP